MQVRDTDADSVPWVAVKVTTLAPALSGTVAVHWLVPPATPLWPLSVPQLTAVTSTRDCPVTDTVAAVVAQGQPVGGHVTTNGPRPPASSTRRALAGLDVS